MILISSGENIETSLIRCVLHYVGLLMFRWSFLQLDLDPMEQLSLLPQLLRGSRSPALAIIAKRCETLISERCWC